MGSTIKPFILSGKSMVIGLVALALLLCMTFALADTTSSQQTNTLQSTPYYVASLTANVNTTSTFSVHPPDDISQVTSAIITVQAYSTPTVNFTLWVNGKACRNPSVVISTTFANAGLFAPSFDCANVITGEGNYTVTLRSDKNIGNVYTTLALTYMNAPRADLSISGTDYEPGDNAKVFTTLVDSTGVPQNNASCLVEIFYPNSTDFLAYTPMTFLEDGIYYYDFTAPSTIGVYPVEIKCSYIITRLMHNVTTITRVLGAGSGSNINLIDGSYATFSENLGDNRNIRDVFNFTGINKTRGTLTDINFLFTGNRPQLGLDPASDPIVFWAYNYTSGKYVVIGNDFSYLAVDTSKDYRMSIGMSDVISNDGNLSILINDTVNTVGGDLANTILSIDQLTILIDFTVPNSSITTVAGGGELNIRNRTGTLLNATLNFNTTGILNYLAQINSTTNRTLTLVDNITVTNAAILGNLSVVNNNVLTAQSYVLSVNQSLTGANGNFTVALSYLSLLNTTLTNTNIALNGMNTTLNSHTATLSAINGNVATIQADVLSVMTDTGEIINTLNGVAYNVSHLNFTGNVSVNVSVDLTNITLRLNDISNNVSFLIVGFNALVNDTALANGLLEDINATIHNQSVNVNVNLTGNFSDLNNSITGAVTAGLAQPRTFDAKIVFIILYIVLMLISIKVTKTWYLGLVGMYGVIFGLFMVVNTGFFVGIIIIGIGLLYFIGTVFSARR